MESHVWVRSVECGCLLIATLSAFRWCNSPLISRDATNCPRQPHRGDSFCLFTFFLLPQHINVYTLGIVLHFISKLSSLSWSGFKFHWNVFTFIIIIFSPSQSVLLFLVQKDRVLFIILISLIFIQFISGSVASSSFLIFLMCSSCRLHYNPFILRSALQPFSFAIVSWSWWDWTDKGRVMAISAVRLVFDEAVRSVRQIDWMLNVSLGWVRRLGKRSWDYKSWLEKQLNQINILCLSLTLWWLCKCIHLMCMNRRGIHILWIIGKENDLVKIILLGNEMESFRMRIVCLITIILKCICNGWSEVWIQHPLASPSHVCENVPRTAGVHIWKCV